MNRRTFLTTTGSLATLSLANTATAQERDEQTNTTTTTQPEDDQPELIADLGSGVKLRDIDRRQNAIVLTLDSDLPSTLFDWQDNMAAMLQADRQASSDGVSAVNMEGHQTRLWLDSGTQDVVLDVAEWRNSASVTVNTANGPSYVLSTQLPNISIFDGEATWGLAGIGGLSAFGATAWGTKRYRESKLDEEDERRSERID
jgi:hypothetical protein